jgi:hypothetical protein
MPTIYEWPFDFAADLESHFWLRPSSLSSDQPATGSRSVYGPLVQRWMADIPVTRRDRRDWLRMSSFISRLAGVRGLVRIGDPKRPHCWVNLQAAKSQVAWKDGTFWNDGGAWEELPIPAYVTAQENVAAKADNVLVGGFPASVSPVLVIGDLFEVRPGGAPASHGHLYEVSVDAASDSSGEARLYFCPPLRAGLAAGDQIVLARPKSVFGLVDDNQGQINHMAGGVANLGMSLMEYLP